MPGGDHTGPLGTGPMSGRGAGLCGSYSSYANEATEPDSEFMPIVRISGKGSPFWGRNFGRCGKRRESSRNKSRGITTGSEIERLQTQAEQYKNMLRTIEERLSELKAKE